MNFKLDYLKKQEKRPEVCINEENVVALHVAIGEDKSKTFPDIKPGV